MTISRTTFERSEGVEFYHQHYATYEVTFFQEEYRERVALCHDRLSALDEAHNAALRWLRRQERRTYTLSGYSHICPADFSYIEGYRCTHRVSGATVEFQVDRF